MSQIIYKTEIEGTASNTGGSVDAFFDNLATESATIDQDNTRTEWASTKHIQWEDKPLTNTWISRENDVGTPTAYANTTFASITHGANGSTEIVGLSHPVILGDVLRYHFNIVADPCVDTIDPNNVEDYWWMKAEYQTGGAAWNLLGYITRNSFTNVRGTSGTPYPITGYRRYGMSFIKSIAVPGTITGIRVQVRTETASIPLVLRSWNQDLRIIVN